MMSLLLPSPSTSHASPEALKPWNLGREAIPGPAERGVTGPREAHLEGWPYWQQGRPGLLQSCRSIPEGDSGGSAGRVRPHGEQDLVDAGSLGG